MGIFNKLRNLDAYPKVDEDFYSRTLSGGLITVISSFIILFLFLSEISLFLSPSTETKLVVDTSRGEMLHVNFDITFPSLACSFIAVDTVDISGEQHYDIRHDILKKRVDRHGNVIASRQDGIGAAKIERPLQRHGGRLDDNETYCGSCYGAEAADDHCCNSCEEVHDAYKTKGWGLANPELIDQCTREGFISKIIEEEGEGCNIDGFVEVSKVAGNFHFAAGKSLQHSHSFISNLLDFEIGDYNVTHRINKLSFGKEFPGVVNPLDGAQSTQKTSGNGVYQYFIKVVPTIYNDKRGRKIYSNQFSVTEHYISDTYHKNPPGVYFIYDFSPIKVIYSEGRIPFVHFLTNICAIIGGAFTVAGIVDSFIYHGHQAIKKKVELGKFR